MKLAAISDIHGNVAALDAVLADISLRGIGEVVNLGDIASGPLHPRETVDRLMPLGMPTIKDNHERQLLTLAPDQMGQSDRSAVELLREDQLSWMTSLPNSLLMWDEVLLVHGTPGSDVEYFLETVTEHGLRPATIAEVAQRAAGVKAEVILCGHTHLPKVVQLEGGPLIVNPGSVGLPAYEDDKPHPHHVESGTPQAQYAVLERGPDGWRTELVAVDYDWTLAARYAADHNRLDWANALATGYV